MSSYLEKYHLQKVEPVKNRNKHSHPDFNKFKQRVQKGNVVKIPIKPRPPHHQYFDNDQARLPNRNPKTEQVIRHHYELTTDTFRNRTAEGKKKDEELSEDKMTHRSHQSLNFKSAKETSAGTKILSSIQDFFNKLMRSNQGCSCGDPCPFAIKFFQWADVPYEIVKDHYFKILNSWEDAIKVNPNESSGCSIENYLNRRTSKAAFQYEQLRKNSIQIKKDINRTQSESLTFQNDVFKERMTNILMSYGFEDMKVGYIQGMNMILSGIIYHVKDEVKCYAVFRKLIFTIRTIYFNGFKECYEHIGKIRGYVDTHIHDLYQMFQELAVDLNIVCLPWVLSLLTSLVPLQHLHLIYLGFIEGGWSFFYKVCLGIMIYHKERMIDLYDSGQILSIFSATNDKKGDYDWQDIIQFSKNIVL